MSTDEYKKLCDNLDARIVLHQTIKEPISQDLDNLIKLSVAYDKLQEENQELKKQLEEANKKLYLCTPEIPRNVHGEYVSYVDLVNEIYELKKQLEDMTDCRDIASGHRKEVQDRETILLKQQQEFLKYLEDKIILCKNRPDYMVIGIHGSYDLSEIELNILEEILQKYLKIIGVSDK